MEVWKDVVGYEGLYQVSNLGNVKSFDMEYEIIRNGTRIRMTRKGRVLKPLIRKHGYLGVQLHGKGGNKRGFRTFSIHRLVAEAFISNPKQCGEVNHIDEDKQNNRVENLEWVTHKENMNTEPLKKRFIEREPNHTRAILQLDNELNVINEFKSAKEAERVTGISNKVIWYALNNNSNANGFYWKYIQEERSNTKR